MREVKFDIAEEKHLDEVFSIVKAAIEEMNKQDIPQWDEIYPDKDILQDDIKKRQLYVGRINDEIACIYVLNNECDEEYANGNWEYPNATYNVIHRMCVNPKFQKQGIGPLTLSYIEENLKRNNIEAIRLDAFSLNPFALKMYYKQGYTKVGEVTWRKGEFFLMEKKL